MGVTSAIAIMVEILDRCVSGPFDIEMPVNPAICEKFPSAFRPFSCCRSTTWLQIDEAISKYHLTSMPGGWSSGVQSYKSYRANELLAISIIPARHLLKIEQTSCTISG